MSLSYTSCEDNSTKQEKIQEEPSSTTTSSQDERAKRIAQALRYHRQRRGGGIGLVDTDGSNSREVPPEHFLAMFSKAVSETLSLSEIEQFVSTLQYACEIRSDSAHLSHLVDRRTLRFYEEETSLTNGSRDRLAAPSGQPIAELGLLMHCQTKHGKVGEFWDEDSQTISLCVTEERPLSRFRFLFRPALARRSPRAKTP